MKGLTYLSELDQMMMHSGSVPENVSGPIHVHDNNGTNESSGPSGHHLISTNFFPTPTKYIGTSTSRRSSQSLRRVYSRLPASQSISVYRRKTSEANSLTTRSPFSGDRFKMGSNTESQLGPKPLPCSLLPDPVAKAGTKESATIDVIVQSCIVCHKWEDQHLITLCDTCNSAFHLACLDPPLTRMPRKTKLYGW
ncbi:unnamed protein product [Protopolystoma xenopodis]|uniref:PHD-type domain-containing protein n=1 Tax=Protopolystoma xenopodis TaxID=117903 RepID=A0A3S5AAD9_9PLAT|nr:unnamed protein product [Protopolystoma xenopodis]